MGWSEREEERQTLQREEAEVKNAAQTRPEPLANSLCVFTLLPLALRLSYLLIPLVPSALLRDVAAPQAKQMLREADVNGDGRISRDEFRQLLEEKAAQDSLSFYDARLDIGSAAAEGVRS